MPVGLCSGGTRSVPSVKARARVPRMKAAVLERRTALAREWILNEGFYAPCKEELSRQLRLHGAGLTPGSNPNPITISPSH